MRGDCEVIAMFPAIVILSYTPAALYLDAA